MQTPEELVSDAEANASQEEVEPAQVDAASRRASKMETAPTTEDNGHEAVIGCAKVTKGNGPEAVYGCAKGIGPDDVADARRAPATTRKKGIWARSHRRHSVASDHNEGQWDRRH